MFKKISAMWGLQVCNVSKNARQNNLIYPGQYVPTDNELLPDPYCFTLQEFLDYQDFWESGRYPAVPVAQILSAQRQRIDAIRLNIGLADQEFESVVLSVIRNLAGFYHLLPASRSSNEINSGFLFPRALEIGLFSVVAAKSKTVANTGSPSQRSIDRERLVAACLIGGLLREVSHLFQKIRVTHTESELQWNPIENSLHQWLIDNKFETYKVEWISTSEQNLSVTGKLVMARIIAPATLRYLSAASPELVQNLASHISNLIGGRQLD